MILDRLRALQEHHGYLPRKAVRRLARDSGVPLYELHGLISFYPHLRSEPPSADRDEGPREPRADRLREILSAPVPPADPPARPERLRCDPYGPEGEPYRALRRMLDRRDGEEAIRVLEASGLRGMGGAGFPTGLKWRLVRGETGPEKVAVCNADESEPGTYKDRFLLEEAPHLVWEGLALAALTVGARRGIVFIREEYRTGRERLERAMAELRRRPEGAELLSGSEPALSLEVAVSPGGYICGEETGLLEALEGRRGEPRNKPPFPASRGLHGRPTLINNVETLAMVPVILLRGADWWADQGRGESRGLKLLALSGPVARPGIYEVPAGLPLTELLERAGGMLDGRELLAFAPGGASAPLLPASRAEVPLDFEPLAEAGSMLGSGAVMVIARGEDPWALALQASRFFLRESCGQCAPCRVGCRELVALLERMRAGGGPEEAEREALRDLAAAMADGSICGLGQAAPNWALSVLEGFP